MFEGQRIPLVWSKDGNRIQSDQKDNLENDGEIGLSHLGVKNGE